MSRYQQKKVVTNNRTFARKARENKKAVIAVCLIAVMAFMWIRVLTKNKPESSRAAGNKKSGTESAGRQNTRVTFLRLPEIKGRNNTLNRDFFDSKDWVNFVGKDKEKTIGTDKNPDERAEQRIVDRLAQKLRLQAIITGEKPCAFINDEPLSIGNKFSLKEGKEVYVFEVKNIKEDRIKLKCKNSDVTLRFKQN